MSIFETQVAKWLSEEYGCTVRVIVLTPNDKQPEEAGIGGWFTIGIGWLKKRAETNNELMDILVRAEI